MGKTSLGNDYFCYSINIFSLLCSSLALWNISEPHYWHPMLSEQRKRLIPSQLVTPAVQNQNGRSQDTGKVVSIRNIYSNIEFVDDCNPKQVSITLESFGFI